MFDLLEVKMQLFIKLHFYISNVTSNREYIIEKSESFNTIYDYDLYYIPIHF